MELEGVAEGDRLDVKEGVPDAVGVLDGEPEPVGLGVDVCEVVRVTEPLLDSDGAAVPLSLAERDSEGVCVSEAVPVTELDVEVEGVTVTEAVLLPLRVPV